MLDGKVAIVTGASRGIGRAIAVNLAAQKARVFINYRQNEQAARQVQEEIVKEGGAADLLECDVASPDNVAGAVKKVLEAAGHIDILVNNAGRTRDNIFVFMKESDWDEVLDTNLKGTYLMTKAVIRPMFKAKWGRIVTIASVAGQYGNPGQVNYSASKAGIIGFTKAVGRELAERGITVNAVSPGLIDTEMSRSLPEKARQEIVSQIPIGRIGTAEEVADAVSFLVSEWADYITGQVIAVNGGLFM
ncbi:MAG: 3-oxoacyl-[acyl-carrier-protein] reductase [Deltaproteobacteria bacterium]|nr:3-oxoacyl-[acyl-carrier-protein] reductase [Candidatus Zymogenaceae bacterium]